MTHSIEELRHRKNELSDLAKKGITEEIRLESQHVGKKIKEFEANVQKIEEQFKALYLRCPNIPHNDVPEGGKESNVVVKTFGTKPLFSFPLKNHLELGASLGWFDFEAAAVMTKSNFVLYKNDAVRLLYALLMFMLQHNAKHGFSYVYPPAVVNERSLEISGNFPKFYEDVYTIQEDNLYLIPTSEVCLANMYRNTIFSADQLPIRLTAATSCFRREAGGYGAHERGLIRIHQFEKVELYTYCVPEESNNELERMLYCAEEILKKLDLHYQVSLLAAQDCSFQSAKTYDIEVWLPGQNCYKEVSSASDCGSFQSRRGGMRYRKEVGEKTMLIHTLNASSLALPRLIIAIMETYQQEDGSVAIPEVLKPWML